MLRDRIKKTKDLMIQAKTAQSVQDRHRRSVEFAELVKEKLPPLMKEVKAVQLVEQNYPNQWRLPSISETMQNLKELIAEIEQNPKGKFGDVLRSFELFRREAKNQWQEIAKKQHQDNQKALVVFRYIRKEDINIARMTQIFDSIEKSWPVTEKNLLHYKNTLQEARQFIALLGAGKQVQQFLEKMTRGEATLEDMNDEVLHWIRVQGLTSNVLITFK